MTEKTFRTIYVAEASHDLTPLKKYTKDIRIVSSGYEELENLDASVRKNLQDFEPATDAFVPIGRSVLNLWIGDILGTMFPDNALVIGVWTPGKRDYLFYEKIFGNSLAGEQR